MSQLSEELVLDSLKQIIDPDLRKDIVTLGFVRDLKIADGDVSFRIVLTTPACPVKDEMEGMAREIVRVLPGVANVNVTMDAEVPQGRGIANNVAIDHLRKRQLPTISMDGSPHASTSDAVEATTLQIADHQESALEEMESRELGTAIEQAIASLRPEYRACIMLRHVEDRSYEEIAATLDLPLGTVKTYIHRARHELRKALEDRR